MGNRLSGASIGKDAKCAVYDAPGKVLRNTCVHRVAQNRYSRDVAVGGIHGSFTALWRSLVLIEFDARVDRLFCTGDLVDRGDESHRVVEWLSQPWFFSVCGNHDFMAWRSALNQSFNAVRHKDHGGEWLCKVAPAARRRIGEHLRHLPMAIEVETAGGIVGVVHADFPYDDLNSIALIDWSGADSHRSDAARCLWSSERFTHRYKSPVRNVRALIYGHTTVPELTVLGNVYFIDTAGSTSKRLTLIDVELLKVLHPVQAGSAPGQLARRFEQAPDMKTDSTTGL